MPEITATKIPVPHLNAPQIECAAMELAASVASSALVTLVNSSVAASTR